MRVRRTGTGGVRNLKETIVDRIEHGPAISPAVGRATEKIGLLLFMTAMTAFVVCVGSFALRQVDVGIGAAIVALLAAGGALAWLTTEGRRDRDVQRTMQAGRRRVAS